MSPDKKRLRIGVLFGGRSGEHEVSLASAASVIRGLDPDKYEVVPIGVTKEGHWLIGGGQRIDVVFPVMHGTFGEDGTIQGLLDLAGLPFVGAGVLGSAIAMDKDVAKKLLQAAKIPVVPWVSIRRDEWERNENIITHQIEKEFPYPLFVKPATLGSSVGMSKVHSRQG